MRSIDLNADVGEGAPDDEQLIPLVTSVNVACGAHAGDAVTIDETIRRALAAGAAIGAHPSYPDRDGFGRRDMDLSPADLHRSLVGQIELVADAAGRLGATLTHVKPHGALYNRSARDPDVADALADAVAAVSSDLVLVGLAGSASLVAAREAGVRTASEAFADRRDEPDGRLRNPAHNDAVIDDPEAAAEQAVRIARDGHVVASDGAELRLEADTICVHGDLPGAAARASAVRVALEAAGIAVRSVRR